MYLKFKLKSDAVYVFYSTGKESCVINCYRRAQWLIRNSAANN